MPRTLTPSPFVADELTINWHVTEACNYRCRYCYAQWEKSAARELIHDAEASYRLLESLANAFAAQQPQSLLASHLSWSSLRLNLAGGEPLLYGRRIVEVARQATSLGMKVSLITNGSLLTEPLLAELADWLTLLGVSVDSASAAVAQAIGRQDRRAQGISPSELAARLRYARNLNPALAIKINTVVNALNHQEDLGEMINMLAPQRWKVLRMLPSTTTTLAVSAEQFAAFVSRHSNRGLPLQVEDNVDMRQSYLMIDPHGRFFQNAANQRAYHYSPPILEVGAAQAFNAVAFAPQRYLARYLRAGGAA